MNVSSHFAGVLGKVQALPGQLGPYGSKRMIRTELVLALALLCVIGMVVYETTLKLGQTEQWESRIEAVIVKLEAIASGLKDAERSQRGYLITGDERYLESYHRVRPAIDQDLRHLRVLTAQNPAHKDKIDQLEPLIAAKFDEIAQTNHLRKNSGFEPAVQVVSTHKGKQIMDEMLTLIGELKDEQNRLLRQETEGAEARLQTLNLNITFGSFLAIVLAVFMISRDIVERRRAREALRESTARFHRLAEHALDLIYRYRLQPTPRFEYVSPAAIAITGYTPADFYDDPELGSKLVYPEDQRLIETLQHPVDATAPLTVRWQHKDGHLIWTSQQLVSIYDPAGTLVAVEGIVRDITDRMQAYQTLERRVEERTHEIERRRQVAEGLRDILTILNSNRPLDEILASIVAQACRLLGTDAGAVYHLQDEKNLLCTQVAHGLEPGESAIHIPVGWSAVGEAVLHRRPVVVSNAQVSPPEGSDLILDAQQWSSLASLFGRYGALLAIPLMLKDDMYGAIALFYHSPREFTHEETELAVAFGDQAALAIENARLRMQAEQMAVAAERSRLARDLHDAVTQTLFSTSLIADVLPRLWERDQHEALRRLNELRQLTRGALAEMRALLLELRPATLTEVAIADLMRQLVEAVAGQARVPISLTVEGRGRLPPDVHVAVYRIAQEALNNVARHANAGHAAVFLRCEPDQVELRISDDGQGFDPSGVTLDHLGLGIMRERAERIGAELRLESQVGSGTQVTIIWPLSRSGGGAP